MRRTCSVCKHENVNEINAALLRGDSYRPLASRYGMSTTALQRHKRSHLPVLLTKAADAAEIVRADNLLASIRALHVTTLEILRKAQDAGRLECALKAIQQARANLELLAKLDGQLKDREPGEVHIVVNYVDRAIIAPNATAPRCIGAGSVMSTLQSDGRQKGEAQPFDGPQL